MEENFMKANRWHLRSMFAVVAMLSSLVLATGPFSSSALAHNGLLKTEPAAHAVLKTAPARIQFWFQEKPDLTVTKVVVKGPAGAVETGPAHPVSENVLVVDFKGKLAAGEYTVTWQTAGDDSHISKGTFSFAVATP
jgi:methionine-rich copper-binding protein CopC